MLESVLIRVLRAVFGGGADISAANPLETHDPKVGSLISYEGKTTANGLPGGTTLVCSNLTTKPDFDGNLVIITSGAYEGQGRDINGVTTGGTVTPSRPFGGQIVSGVKFVIVGITTTPAEVAAIEAKLDLPAPDAILNTRIAEVVGNKADNATADNMSALATASLVAELKRALLRMSPDAFTATIQGAARTELDTMMAQLAIYFNAAGAALSVVSQPGVAARTNLNAILTDLADILAGDAGIVTFPAASPPANGVSLAEVTHYISDALDALSTLYETGGTLLADGNEQDVVIVNAPAGVFNPMIVKIDLDNMAVGDTTVIKVYDRIKSGGGLQLVDYQSYAGADGGLSDGKKAIYVELKPNRYGFKVTLQQTGGVNCNYDWEYFYES